MRTARAPVARNKTLPSTSGSLGLLVPVFGVLLMTGLERDAAARSICWNRVINAKPSGLSRSDRRRAARLMNKINVYYGCSDTVASCLATDRKSQTARRIAGLIVRMVGKGRTAARIKREVRLRGLSAHPFKKHRFNLKRRPRYGASARKAKVTIVEFADFECPFCRVISPQIKRVVRALKSQGVALVYKHFPVSSHKRAIDCGRAAYAAHKLGRFWRYHDLLYRMAPRLSNAELSRYAQKVGLDRARFQAIRSSRRSRLILAADKKEGLRAGTRGTPTFFINGKLYRARKDYTEMRDRVEEDLNLVRGGR